MQAAEDLAAAVGTARACACLGVPRASLYRRRGRASAPLPPTPRPAPPLQLSEHERTEALALLYGERFVDASPYTLYATLLDEGRYLCSVRTLYRLLAEQGAGRERRNQLRHPAYAKPELLATAPNQLWSWDITKLKGPAKWTYFYLYVIIDVFSRYVVGWMVATRECSTLAKQLIAETCTKHAINAGQLTLHADRGPSMTSKPLALLLADLGVTKTHSRPLYLAHVGVSYSRNRERVSARGPWGVAARDVDGAPAPTSRPSSSLDGIQGPATGREPACTRRDGGEVHQ
jgi:putative transposase